MSSLLFQNATIVTPDEILRRGFVLVERGRIRSVGTGVPELPRAPIQTIDASDGLLVPGYTDLQVNGAMGEEFSQSPVEKYDRIVRHFVEHGTTAMLATVLTDRPDRMLEAIRRVAAYRDSESEYADAVIGIHVEGPFLNPQRRGAHPQHLLRKPNVKEVRRWLRAAPDAVRMVTLAPELEGAQKVIRLLRDAGVVVAASHSLADYRCMAESVKNGLSFVTHVGNTTDWPYRKKRAGGWLGAEPGVVGSFLCMEEPAGSVILDGFHFHPAMLKPIVRCKGPEKVALITDAAFVAGLPPGMYRKGKEKVAVTTQGYTVGRRKGWLAGSTLTMDRAVRNAVRLAGVLLTDAVRMATLSPANVLDLRKKGRIAPGYDADFLILDSDLNVKMTVRGGTLYGSRIGDAPVSAAQKS
jgi:N-acetylglucosamine-6-phosphate deacetylase